MYTIKYAVYLWFENLYICVETVDTPTNAGKMSSTVQSMLNECIVFRFAYCLFYVVRTGSCTLRKSVFGSVWNKQIMLRLGFRLVGTRYVITT